VAAQGDDQGRADWRLGRAARTSRGPGLAWWS